MTDSTRGGLLDGRVAVITGGGRGLGRATALLMAEHGAAVVINDVYGVGTDEPAATSVAAEIRARGGQAVADFGDISKTESAYGTIERGITEFGRVDILANFAGHTVRKKLIDMSDEDWDSIMAVHLRGHFLCSRAAVRHMLERGGGGRIITVSSRAAFYSPVPPPPVEGAPTPAPSGIAYSAAKAGIMGFTTLLARELAGTGITVNCLVPSATTQLFPGAAPRRIGGLPTATSMEPEDIAPVVTCLTVDASAGITGRLIYASGNDICVYQQPLEGGGANVFLRNPSRWTVEQLLDVLPAVAANSS